MDRVKFGAPFFWMPCVVSASGRTLDVVDAQPAAQLAWSR